MSETEERCVIHRDAAVQADRRRQSADTGKRRWPELQHQEEILDPASGHVFPDVVTELFRVVEVQHAEVIVGSQEPLRFVERLGDRCS